MKYTCLIVDDETPARDLISFYASKINALSVVGSCQNGNEAIEILKKERVDILLLDIQMPDITGIELIRSLDPPPLTIFITAHREYAVTGFDLNVIDYLLKPVVFDRFKQAIDKSLEYLGYLAGHVNKEERKSYFFLKTETKIIKIMFSDVRVFEAQHDYVQVTTASGAVRSPISMNQLENSLPSDFIRIHRSFIINLLHADVVQGNQVEIDQKLYPIGKNYKDSFLEKLNQLKL
jgi:DNA-binding LytR/AlgR family response regulator